MNCSTLGFAVLHCLPKFAQTHDHWVSDAIQPSHPLLSFFSCLQSFPASGSCPVSKLFTSGGQSVGTPASASVLPMNIQSWFPLGWTGLISLQSKRLSDVFSSTTIWKHHLFSTQPSLWSNYYSVLCTVIQSCLTLWDPMDCSPPGFSVHGISQTRILEWVAIPFSRESSWPRDRTWVSCVGGGFFTVWATREAPEYWSRWPIPSPGDLPDWTLTLYTLKREFSGKKMQNSVILGC